LKQIEKEENRLRKIQENAEFKDKLKTAKKELK
jgi:hypothetical protein